MAPRCPACRGRALWADESSGWAKCSACDRTFAYTPARPAEAAVAEPALPPPPAAPLAPRAERPKAQARRESWSTRFAAGAAATTIEVLEAEARETAYRSPQGLAIVRLTRPNAPARPRLVATAAGVAGAVLVGLAFERAFGGEMSWSGSVGGMLAAQLWLAWRTQRLYPPSALVGREGGGLWVEQGGRRIDLGPQLHVDRAADPYLPGHTSISLHSHRGRVRIAAGNDVAMEALEAKLKEHLDLGAPPAMRVEPEEPAAEDSAATGARTRRRA